MTEFILSEEDEAEALRGFGPIPLFASKALTQARLIVCYACPEKSVAFTANICDKCGCWIESKARLHSSKCPLGKWPQPDK